MVKRGLQPQALHTVVLVGDTVFATKTPPHPACAGLDGGCPVCARTARTALRSQHYWHRLALALGLGLSDGRRLWPLIASTLHAAFLAGETGSAHIAVIT
jgi:hypothetical protein